jgi:Double zinc ribbon
VSMRCFRCAIDHPEDKRLCMACGDPLASTEETSPPFPRCFNCGDMVSAADHFCPGCGMRHGDEPLTTAAASQGRPLNGPEEAPSALHRGTQARLVHRREGIAWVFFGLVVALLFALGVRTYRAGGWNAALSLATSAAPEPAISCVATADAIGIKIVGAGAVDPGRSVTVIRQAVEQHFADLQRSYLSALKVDDDAQGVVILHMTLAADGTVAYVRSSPLGLTDRGFVTIVERQAAAWRFIPSQAGLVSVHYPLVFHLPKTDPRELVMQLQKFRLQGSQARSPDSTRHLLIS